MTGECEMDKEQEQEREQVTVVVLGDLGHSPRMNYHALSLSEEGFEVNLVGFAGSKPQVEVLKDEHITLTYMRPSPNVFNKLPKFSSPDKTVFTERYADGRVSECEDRPALVVSSTSWTEDEDFSILFYALQDYERVRQEFPDHYPPLIVVVTGKGPTKSYYATLISERQWSHVVVITPWMSAEDYPTLLASADFGVCLHYSSSGLDLPMKVVDMFGSGIPVAAIDYPALPELVHHNENGLVFKNKEELANLLQDWFRGFPKET
ncbi:Chitobiosyldiphosphodolichol beta-mannosyltransferase-like, partial [Homarus americanus]